MRILLTGGGTGGHVYPALAVAEALPARAAGEPLEFLFAGSARGDVGRLAARAGIPFVAIEAAPVRGNGLPGIVRAAWRTGAGVVRSWRVLGRFKPRVVVATGGYASVPVSVAARLRGIPLVVYLPDVHPGWAVRLLVRLARRVATTTDAALAYLPRNRTVVTGYPVRPEFWQQSRAGARARLGVEPDVPLLLVTGGTQGAQALNHAVLQVLPALIERGVVLHQTGPAGILEAERAAGRLPAAQRCRYRPLPYLNDMAVAMAAADLAIMRAGASSLAEPPAVGLPTILVPGTFAGGHQRYNATYMASRGAALLLEEARLAELAPLLRDLLTDRTRLAAMAAAARALARRDAARRIADVVLEAAT